MPWVDQDQFAGVDPQGGNENPVISVDDLAEWIGLVSPSTNQLARLQTATELATGYVSAALGRPVWPVADETSTIDGTGAAWFAVPFSPVLGITTITQDGTAVDAGDYEWTEWGRVYRVRGCWTTTPRGLVVLYDHGWNTIPRVILGVALSCAARLYTNSNAGAGTIIMEKRGTYEVQYAPLAGGQLSPDETAALGSYRDWPARIA